MRERAVAWVGALGLGVMAPGAWAQLDALRPPPDLPSLPGPPPLESFLFENPIPLVILTAALVLAVVAISRRLGRSRRGVIGAAIVGFAGLALVAVALLVETERERLRAQTRDLVRAVAEVDIRALETDLAETARLYADRSTSGRGKGEIIALVERYMGGAFAVAEHRVSQVQAEVGPSGRTARTRATVYIEPVSAGMPSRFVCMLTWRKDGGVWRVAEIEPLWLQGYGEISTYDLQR